jgi:hypothetical protein
MSIIPPEIPVAPFAPYDIADPATANKLDNPSHSAVHTKTNAAVEALHGRVAVTESGINSIWPQMEVLRQEGERARLAAHMWTVPGPLDELTLNSALLPPIWNMTGRSVLFSAARATVYTPPQGKEIKIEIWAGTEITGKIPDTTNMHMVLAAPLTIPVNSYTSDMLTIDGGGFAVNAFHAQGEVLIAIVTQVGDTAPGADLTIQLNRML